MNHVRLVSDLGLKTTLDHYEAPRGDLPTITEHALGGRNGIHGDVVAFLEGLFFSPRKHVRVANGHGRGS